MGIGESQLAVRRKKTVLGFLGLAAIPLLFFNTTVQYATIARIPLPLALLGLTLAYVLWSDSRS